MDQLENAVITRDVLDRGRLLLEAVREEVGGGDRVTFVAASRCISRDGLSANGFPCPDAACDLEFRSQADITKHRRQEHDAAAAYLTPVHFIPRSSRLHFLRFFLGSNIGSIANCDNVLSQDVLKAIFLVALDGGHYKATAIDVIRNFINAADNLIPADRRAHRHLIDPLMQALIVDLGREEYLLDLQLFPVRARSAIQDIEHQSYIHIAEHEFRFVDWRGVPCIFRGNPDNVAKGRGHVSVIGVLKQYTADVSSRRPLLLLLLGQLEAEKQELVYIEASLIPSHQPGLVVGFICPMPRCDFAFATALSRDKDPNHEHLFVPRLAVHSIDGQLRIAFRAIGQTRLGRFDGSTPDDLVQTVFEPGSDATVYSRRALSIIQAGNLAADVMLSLHFAENDAVPAAAAQHLASLVQQMVAADLQIHLDLYPARAAQTVLQDAVETSTSYTAEQEFRYVDWHGVPCILRGKPIDECKTRSQLPS
ncbi:hypothetical protein BJ508DRAFT_367754 [Ascobolus immersus RN42]|uniref:C2H2-type domain-containing protein n=1 Tax=Ascobolus immersus RN42 TaxID=1160509 RepID=A0A3N4HA71_ASCIM|nr:hypothetical protein BJ508DRAFT_367754 [Ascobolus immersus RN42]